MYTGRTPLLDGICSFVSLVLPAVAEAARNLVRVFVEAWPGFGLGLGFLGFGWAEEQLMLMMIHTQVRFGYSSWVNTPSIHTQTHTHPETDWQTDSRRHKVPYAQYGELGPSRSWSRIRRRGWSWLWCCGRFTYLCQFLACVRLWLVCYCSFSAGLPLFKHLKQGATWVEWPSRNKPFFTLQ